MSDPKAARTDRPGSGPVAIRWGRRLHPGQRAAVAAVTRHHAPSRAGRVVTMLQTAGGLLLGGVAGRVPASEVQAGLRRQRHGPPVEPGAGTDTTTDREAGS
ncbi:hypothetical protein GCM10010271_08040 [Streptomyces kurssanovii]|nr:hypothetical protein GCM10010271_08040 [Streptomyces kurssanovii]